MIVASKYLPLILAFALSDTAVAEDLILSSLRGKNRNRPGNGNGNGLGKLRKLNAEGCTVLEKASLCFPLNGKPLPCEDEAVSSSLRLSITACKKLTMNTAHSNPSHFVLSINKREFACEEVSTGHIYRIEDDLIGISKGNRPGLDVNDYADILQSAQALFIGDADVDPVSFIIKFKRGRFDKASSKGGGGRALQSVGSPKVLALNVVSSENTTTGYTNAHLSDSIFGSLVGGSDLVTIASQVRACSHGKLQFVPLPDKTSGNTTLVGDVSDGVATVYSTVSAASGQGKSETQNTSYHSMLSCLKPIPSVY